MSVFDTIIDYSMPSDILKNYLNIYKSIGNIPYIKNQLKDLLEVLEEKSINDDAIAVINYLGIKASKDRVRLIIEKDSTPKNIEEEKISGIKHAIKLMHVASINKVRLNSVDFLDYLKMSTKENINFNSKNYQFMNSLKSHRFHFNELIDDYENFIISDKYECITLTSILQFNVFNMNPFEKYNDLMFIYLYYYSMLRFGIEGYRYCGKLNEYINNLKPITDSIIKGSVNYDRGVFLINDLVRQNQMMIISSLESLKKKKEDNYQANRSQKGDNVEMLILYEMPAIFSKEDVLKKIPNVSNSTIMRCFDKLKEKGFIIPLGTGRSAKWQKIVDKNDPKIVFGDDFND